MLLLVFAGFNSGLVGSGSGPVGSDSVPADFDSGLGSDFDFVVPGSVLGPGLADLDFVLVPDFDPGLVVPGSDLADSGLVVPDCSRESLLLLMSLILMCQLQK